MTVNVTDSLLANLYNTTAFTAVVKRADATPEEVAAAAAEVVSSIRVEINGPAAHAPVPTNDGLFVLLSQLKDPAQRLAYAEKT